MEDNEFEDIDNGEDYPHNLPHLDQPFGQPDIIFRSLGVTRRMVMDKDY